VFSRITFRACQETRRGVVICRGNRVASFRGLLSMRRQLTLSDRPIDEAALLRQRQMSEAMGAVVCFAGVVRGQEEGHAVGGLEYEAFARMAERQLRRLFDELEKRWPVESARVVHRLGVVKVGETALWVEVIAPHRAEAFAACQWLIGELKRLVPIWKKPVSRGSQTGPGKRELTADSADGADGVEAERIKTDRQGHNAMKTNRAEMRRALRAPCWPVIA